MALPLVPGTASIVATGIMQNGQRWMNTFHRGIGTTALDQTISDTIAAEVADAYAEIMPRWHVGFSLDDFIVTDLRAAGAPQFHSTPSVPLIGGSTTQPLPMQVAAMVSWSTDFRGRAGRGRTYLTGWTEDDSVGDDLVAGTITALEAFASAIVDTGTYYVVSLFEGVAQATTGSRRFTPIARAVGEHHTISAAQVRSTFKTQRRRQG